MFHRQKLPSDHIFSFKKAKLSYRALGKGKKVVFLHGSLTNSLGYDEFIKTLAQFYHLYVLDLPGFGGSDVVNGRVHDGELFSEVFSAFIKKLHLEKADCVALSYGVTIVASVAVKKNLLGKLCFLGTPGKTNDDFMTHLSTTLPLFIKRFLSSTYWGRKNLVLPIIRSNTETTSKNNDTDLLEQLSHTDSRAIADPNYKHEIESQFQKNLLKIKNKVLFVYGENDRFKQQEFRLNGVEKYIEVPKAGHNVCADEPKKTVQILRGFFG